MHSPDAQKLALRAGSLSLAPNDVMGLQLSFEVGLRLEIDQ
jgi:hypothetical protein